MTYLIYFIEKREKETTPPEGSLSNCLGHSAVRIFQAQWVWFRGLIPLLPQPCPRVHSGRDRLGPGSSLSLENQAARDHSEDVSSGGSGLAFVT